MRGDLRVADGGLHPAQAGCEPGQLEALDHALHRVATSLEVERHHPAGSAGQQASRHRKRGRRIQQRVVHMNDPSNRQQCAGQGEGILAVPSHAHVKGAQAAEREPRVEGSQRRPHAGRARANRAHDLGFAYHHARH